MSFRTCILCNRKRLKKALIRIVPEFGANVGMDDSGHAQGRGAYLCSLKDVICNVDRLKRQRVESALKYKIRTENWDKFMKDLSSRYESTQ